MSQFNKYLEIIQEGKDYSYNEGLFGPSKEKIKINYNFFIKDKIKNGSVNIGFDVLRSQFFKDGITKIIDYDKKTYVSSVKKQNEIELKKFISEYIFGKDLNELLKDGIKFEISEDSITISGIKNS